MGSVITGWKTWTSRWWEATVVGLAAYLAAVIFFGDAGGWGLLLGSAAVLLIGGLALRGVWRIGGSAMVIAGSVLAAIPWWGIFNVILALVIIFGGFAFDKIGPDAAKVAVTAT
jgi:hypothetical protein